MALKLQYFPDEGTIRSIGDAPNGILMIGGNHETGATLAVHPGVEPPTDFGDGGAAIKRLDGDSVGKGEAIAVDTAEVVTGCANPETIAMVWKTMMLATAARAEEAVLSFAPEDVVAFGTLAVELRDEIAKIYPPDGDPV